MMIKPKLIIIFIFLIIGIFVASTYLFFEKRENEVPQTPITTVGEPLMQTDTYATAITLFSEGKYDEARQLFTQLEEEATMYNDIAHLQLKKMQSFLREHRYPEAIEALTELVHNPMLPNATKARAMENVFMWHQGTAEDRYELFHALFTSEKFRRYATSTGGGGSSDWLPFMEFSYTLHPTTVFGYHVIGHQLLHLDNIEDPEVLELQKNAAAAAVDRFFVASNEENDTLYTLPYQELQLVNNHLDRANLILMAQVRNVPVPTDVSAEDEYVKAILAAETSGNSFALFRSVYKYLTFIYPDPQNIDERVVDIMRDEAVFDPERISKSQYEKVVGPTGHWQEEHWAFIRSVNNPALIELLETYQYE